MVTGTTVHSRSSHQSPLDAKKWRREASLPLQTSHSQTASSGGGCQTGAGQRPWASRGLNYLRSSWLSLRRGVPVL